MELIPFLVISVPQFVISFTPGLYQVDKRDSLINKMSDIERCLAFDGCHIRTLIKMIMFQWTDLRVVALVCFLRGLSR